MPVGAGLHHADVRMGFVAPWGLSLFAGVEEFVRQGLVLFGEGVGGAGDGVGVGLGEFVPVGQRVRDGGADRAVVGGVAVHGRGFVHVG